MRLDDDFDFEEDDYEDNYLNSMKNSNKNVITMAVICISILTLLILFLVLRMNTNQSKNTEVSRNTALQETIKDMEEQHAVQSEMEHSLEELISGSTLTADDLDIWDTSEELQSLRQEKEQEEENVKIDSVYEMKFRFYDDERHRMFEPKVTDQEIIELWEKLD